MPSTSGSSDTLTKLSDGDLLALKAGDYSRMSDDGLKTLKASSASASSEAPHGPTFTFTSPEGKSYSVSGPQGATAEQAFQILQQHLGGAQPPSKDDDVSTVGDVAMQLPTGFNEGLANTVGAPVDAMSFALRKMGLPIPANTFGGSQSIKNGLGYINANPDNAPAQTTAGQLARATGSGVANTLVPESALATAARAGIVSPRVLAAAQQTLGNGSSLTRSAAVGAGSGFGSEAAGQATQGSTWEPYARMAGSVAGGGIAGAATAPRQAAQALPTIDDVKAAASANYNSPELMALRVNGGAVNNLGDNISRTLEQRGFFREDHGPVFNAVDRLSNAGPSVDFNHLDAIRKALGNRAGEIDAFGRSTPTAAAATRAKGLLDDFINTDMTNPNNVLTGNPVAAREAIAGARANSGAAIRAEQVLNKINNAQDDAAAANSGMNIQNRIRQKLKTFVQNDGAKMGGYTDAEQAQMQRLVRGSMLMNSLRHVGNALGGGGLHAIPEAFIGHAIFGPVGTALPAAGWAMKTAANIATQRMANNMANTLLSRAPLVQRTLAANRAIRSTNAAATLSGSAHASLRALLINRLLSNSR
jgi:hypothetical protein